VHGARVTDPFGHGAVAGISGACRRSELMLSHGDDGRGTATAGETRARREERAARRHAIAERALQTSADGILAFDRDLHITAWNRSMETLFGPSAREAVGRSVFAVLPCFLANGDAPLFRSTLEGNAPVSRARPFSIEESGCAGLVDCHYSPLRDADGTTSGGLAMFRDRTRSSDVALALRDARDQFTELFDHAPIGMALIEMDRERVGTFLRVNDALCRITGLATAELTGRTVMDVTDPADAAAEIALVGRLLAGELPRYRIEKRLRRAGGTIASVAAGVSLLRTADGITRHGIMQVEDLGASALSGAQDAAAEPVGDLCSRAAFDAALTRQIADAVRYGHPGAVVVIHLDGLARIDETLGREAGDEAIERIAELLCRRTRETDVVAALRRDEFGVLLRLADPQTADAVATALVRQISSSPVVAMGSERPAVHAGAGVVSIDAHSRAGEDLVARARLAHREGRPRKGDVAAGAV
jgi:diguanylate cyclase (GGDEF)-like protein/PAS domain S-box-containing protein